MNTNLLDLNDDVLNIIGDYVKKDNYNNYIDRKKYLMEEFSINWYRLFNIMHEFSIIKVYKIGIKNIRSFMINYLYVNDFQDIETIDYFLTLIKLNLKSKKYYFSQYCIEHLEDSKKNYDEILKNGSVFYIYHGNFCVYDSLKFFLY